VIVVRRLRKRRFRFCRIFVGPVANIYLLRGLRIPRHTSVRIRVRGVIANCLRVRLFWFRRLIGRRRSMGVLKLRVLRFSRIVPRIFVHARNILSDAT
jgi:hypothetical protein